MERRGGHGNPYVPTDSDRAAVMSLAAFDTPVDDIARYLKVNKRTVMKYYAVELANGKNEFHTRAKMLLSKMIMKGDRASLFFYFKCRHGWRENGATPGQIPGDDADGPTLTVKVVGGLPME